MFNCDFVTFPCGIQGQVWYLIVSINDLCCLSYFYNTKLGTGLMSRYNSSYQRGSYKVWEINIGVCPRLEFDNIMLFDCLGMTFILMVHLRFYAIPLLIYDVIHDITIIP